MAIAIEALTAASVGKSASSATTSSVSKDQWTVIGLILVLLLLEAVVHPTVNAWLTGIIKLLHPTTSKTATQSATKQTQQKAVNV